MSDKPRRPSLQDIADKVGTSKMTVSRYLRDANQVSDATGQRIAHAMEQLGYIPNRVPDLLARAKSRAIGVLLPSMSNQVFSSLVHGIEAVTRDADYHTLYGHYCYDIEQETRQVEQLLSFQVDGLILCETLHSERTLRMLQVAAIPVVEVMELPATPVDLAVGLDHQAAAEDMTRLMIERGKRRIAYLAARLDRRTRLRAAGYRAAMEQAGLEPLEIQTEQHSSFQLGGEMLRQALEQAPDLDGVFCTNDDIAAGALLAAQAMQLAVPQRLAVAGFNALDIGDALHPVLASVVTPREAIGRLAAQRLLGRIHGQRYADAVVDLGYTLRQGGSI
ncbi:MULTISPECIES: substrate-binding domain-containing protein [unclassified Chromobacterium]|uniref:substrate-binding domain-containing protein n=1 Tax=unclassified Chromobacterium TaxID=2641838 RepID=UPI00065479A1|nr:substrate-binding domain-containing protein [Chromobacterium sp. LK1]KMN33459.1 transcriptional regulator [Chromobacterium sp. LK1]